MKSGALSSVVARRTLVLAVLLMVAGAAAAQDASLVGAEPTAWWALPFGLALVAIGALLWSRRQ
jgi:hypothetical protein